MSQSLVLTEDDWRMLEVFWLYPAAATQMDAVRILEGAMPATPGKQPETLGEWMGLLDLLMGNNREVEWCEWRNYLGHQLRGVQSFRRQMVELVLKIARAIDQFPGMEHITERASSMAVQVRDERGYPPGDSYREECLRNLRQQ